VPVDKTRSQIFAFQIQDIPPLMVVTYPGDASSIDGDVSLLYLTGEDIDDPGIGQQQVSRGLPFGNRDQLFQILLVQLSSRKEYSPGRWRNCSS
jgi:hypothetical protein